MTAFASAYLPQFRTSTLNVPGGINASQTTGIVLTTIPSDLDITKPGWLCLTYSNPINTDNAEWIYYTSIDGTNTLQGVTRGAEGYAGKAHLNGAAVAWVVSKSHINALMDALMGVTTGVSLNIPKVLTSLNDTNNNEIFKITATASAVNEFTFANAAAGNAPTISVTGGDTNIDLNLVPKGTGVVKINGIPIPAIDGWQSVSVSWAYASADGATGVITVPSGAASLYGVGDRIKLTQTTVKYFIITVVTDTTLTVYGGTDYTLANAAISAIYYSHQKAPLGFPLDPTKWTVEVTHSTSDPAQITPTINTWYNFISITIPIGLWRVEYMATIREDTGASTGSLNVTLSTTNNGQSDYDFTAQIGAAASQIIIGSVSRAKILSLASKTVYYLNLMQDGNASVIYLRDATGGKLFIRAICAYL